MSCDLFGIYSATVSVDSKSYKIANVIKFKNNDLRDHFKFTPTEL